MCSYETYKFPGFSGFRTTTLPTFLESEGEREGDRASVCVCGFEFVCMSRTYCMLLFCVSHLLH